MGTNSFTGMVNQRLNQNGQGNNLSTKVGDITKNIYVAKVISVTDPFEQNRIIAEIINVDEQGNESPGEDRLIPRDKLPFCIPMMPNYIHVRPFEGEMVIIFVENPKDLTSTRFWLGPIITTKLNLITESYLSANKIFDKTENNTKQNIQNSEALSVIPQQGDVAIQGRQDADIILRPREVFITAGKFKNQTSSFEINTTTPLFIQLKQYDNNVINPYSQVNIQGTNINLISDKGKFRNSNQGSIYEPSNQDLTYLGDVANILHPAVFGDELVKLLDLIIRILLTHIHTPQKEAVPTADTKALKEYSIEGKLQDILSKFIRLN